MYLYPLPGVECRPRALRVLVCASEVDLYHLSSLPVSTLDAGLGLHVLREGQVVHDLLKLLPGHIAGQAAGDLVTVTKSFIELQAVRDQHEAPLKCVYLRPLNRKTYLYFTSLLEHTSFSKSKISISEEFQGVVRFQVAVSQLRMSPVMKFLGETSVRCEV